MKRPGGHVDKSHDRALRNLALALASQLPDERADALKVIEYMRHLAEEFFDVEGDDRVRAATEVVAFVKSSPD